MFFHTQHQWTGCLPKGGQSTNRYSFSVHQRSSLKYLTWRPDCFTFQLQGLVSKGMTRNAVDLNLIDFVDFNTLVSLAFHEIFREFKVPRELHPICRPMINVHCCNSKQNVCLFMYLQLNKITVNTRYIYS